MLKIYEFSVNLNCIYAEAKVMYKCFDRAKSYFVLIFKTYLVQILTENHVYEDCATALSKKLGLHLFIDIS